MWLVVVALLINTISDFITIHTQGIINRNQNHINNLLYSEDSLLQVQLTMQRAITTSHISITDSIVTHMQFH